MKWTDKHSFLGIAFGERSVGVAEIGPPARGTSGGAWEVRRAAEFQPAGSLDDAATVDAFKSFLREFGFGASRAVVGVPARWVVAREREVPPSSDEQASSVLRMQAERMFSAELGELAVDYAGTADPSGVRNVLLVALPKRQLERVVKLVESAGKEVAAVMPSTLALSDAIAGEGSDGLVLNIGGDAVELSARRGGAPKLLRHLSVRGNDFASANGAREAAVTSLAGEIRRTVALMPRGTSAGSNASSESLHLWDGVGLGAGDATTLAKQAGVDLRGGSADAPLRAMGLTVKSPEVARFAPALALAVAGARPHTGAVDFLHPRLAPPKKKRLGKRAVQAIGVGVAAVAALLGFWAYVVHLESTVRQQNDEIAVLKPDVDKAQHVKLRIDTARAWYPEGRPAVLDCLRDVVNAFPDGGEAIFVTKLTLTPDTRAGTLIGKSPNRDLVFDLVERLRNNKEFGNVKNPYTLEASQQSSDVAFSITFTYPGGGNAATTQPAKAGATK